jgi:F420-0:gamma-glutamyl ligase
MNVTEIKTRKILPPKDDLAQLLSFIPKLNDKSIVAISSKVISICEGQTKPIDSISHEVLVNKLSAKVLEPIKRGPNDMILTQIGNLLVESAGVDISNANGYYVLLPTNPYKSAFEIWKYLRKRNKVRHLGVVITDSHSVPRRKGAEGFALASYGFKAAHVCSSCMTTRQKHRNQFK